ncbi:MAG: adenylate/guanylate cyclase domain-containing protein [Leptospirales bacterium]|nr:adenylate/guanylate cyclase domain-containing protein [Leptospirales bacterium]
MGNRRSVYVSASEDRLEALIEQRLAPGADKNQIDQRIWDLFGEEWCVMFTDLSGFSRGVAKFGIIHFLQTIHESERVYVPIIEEHDGILLKVEGDSFLVIFRNVNKALQCSLAMQRASSAYNQSRSPEEQLLVCIGLGYGRVLRIGDSDVFGAEVNAASKLGEDTAKAYDILITDATRKAAGSPKGLEFQPLDEAPPGSEGAFRVKYSL